MFITRILYLTRQSRQESRGLNPTSETWRMIAQGTETIRV